MNHTTYIRDVDKAAVYTISLPTAKQESQIEMRIIHDKERANVTTSNHSLSELLAHTPIPFHTCK